MMELVTIIISNVRVLRMEQQAVDRIVRWVWELEDWVHWEWPKVWVEASKSLRMDESKAAIQRS